MSASSISRIVLILFALSSASMFAQDPDPPAKGQDQAGTPDSSNGERWNIHFQATSIGQHHWRFPEKYSGENSLPPHPENRVSLTATAFFIYRLNHHVEIVFNPETAGGRGFGGVTGMAGFTNGEIPRVASAAPKLYLARGYLRATWGIGNATEYVKNGVNQLAGVQPQNRISIIIGRFAVTDYFDCNTEQRAIDEQRHQQHHDDDHRAERAERLAPAELPDGVHPAPPSTRMDRERRRMVESPVIDRRSHQPYLIRGSR